MGTTPQLYDPNAVSISFRGSQITGIAPGTFIAAAMNEDAVKLQVGAGGSAARTKNPNKSGKVTLTLMQTSPSNDVLSGIAAMDDLNGSGIGALFVKDALGTTLIHAANAWVSKLPDVEFAGEAGTRQWVLETDELLMTVGGNR